MAAPSREPFPPITIKASILFFFIVAKAFSLPSLDLNSSHLADLRIVPPLLMIFYTLLADIFVIFSLTRPW